MMERVATLRVVLVVATILLAPTLVLAQGTQGGDGSIVDGDGSVPTLQNPLGDQTFVDLLNAILDGIVLLMIPIIILMVIYAGFLFVTAQGNQEKLSRAKMMLGWTLVGALIILGAQAILDIVTNTVTTVSG